MSYQGKSKIPTELLLAQEYQKLHHYQLSRDLYTIFFENNTHHHLRFKALFEVADNWFHEGECDKALSSYHGFIEYCDSQDGLTEVEQDWVNAYKRLTYSRIERMRQAL